jgi:MFS family permease
MLRYLVYGIYSPVSIAKIDRRVNTFVSLTQPTIFYCIMEQGKKLLRLAVPAGLEGVFRSLKHRNYRLFYSGQLISLMGTWLQTTVLGWVVYDITKSPARLGQVGFVNQLPPLALGVVAGVFADRWDKRRALVITQTLALIQAVAMGTLTLTGHIRIWHIMTLGFMLGVVNAFDMPLRQSFVVEMVGKRDLSNALALNSMMFNMARIVGPAAAGFLLAMTGPSNCFFLNAISYVFVIVALFMMRIERTEEPQQRPSVLASLKEGLGYVRRTPFIRNPLILLSCISFVVMPMTTQMPAAAVEMLHGGPKTLGVLISCIGIGAVIGGLHLASRKSPRKLGALIAASSVIYGAAMLAFSVSPVISVSCPLLICAGMGLMRQNVGCNTLIQTLVQNDMRGRVMGIYAITFAGLAPLGNLFLGWLAAKSGVQSAFALGGFWVLCMAAWFVSTLPEMKRSVARLKTENPDITMVENLEEVI